MPKLVLAKLLAKLTLIDRNGWLGYSFAGF